MISLRKLIDELQEYYDKNGDCAVETAYKDSILDSWCLDRVCFFKDGDQQTIILVME